MDRRVQRTRRALREALFVLVAERGWDRVSVLDVCARADVGRSTFYTHFADREELLLSGFDDLKVELRAGDPRPLGFVGGLVEHVQQNRDLARRVMGRRGGPPVRQRMTRLVVDLVEEDLARLAPASRGADDAPRAEPAHLAALRGVSRQSASGRGSPDREGHSGLLRTATARYLGGALVDLLLWGVEERSLPPAELAALFHRLSDPVLRELAA